ALNVIRRAYNGGVVMSIERAVSRTPRPPTGLRLLRRGRTPGEREGRVLAVRRALKIGGLALAVLVLALAILLFASYFQLSQAHAEEHNHPAADVPIHEKFYSNWMMPDNPNRSCCNRQDCYPTEIRYRDGFWEAKRREDGRYVRVPWEKVEQRRD